MGLLAPEFPPEIGGMHTLAWGMAAALAETSCVDVFTRSRGGTVEPEGFTIASVLTGNLLTDAGTLRSREKDIDCWIILNGGMLPIVPRLERPSYVYLHGNDFLQPWIAYGSWWMEFIRKPYMARLRHAIRRTAMRAAVSRVRHVFVNSDQTAKLACTSLGIAPQRVTVAPPGVDDTFFQPHEPEHAGPLRVLTVARLTRYSARKNVDGVLTALASLRGGIPFHYTVVGDGDDRPRLEQLAASLGIRDHVTFAGALGRDALLACYRKADLFVLASKASTEDVEGFGIVYLEATASGVPVICSREGGATDAVQPGVNGIILPSSSPESIADGIRELVATRERYRPAMLLQFAERYRWPAAVAPIRTRISLEQQPPSRATPETRNVGLPVMR